MKLIVGLGNPGSRYESTRHNIGQRLVKELASEMGTPWRHHPFLRSWVSESKDSSFLMAYPDLFMNLSGEAVRLLVDHWKINSSTDLLIGVDEAALPFGQLRLRPEGQDGGHKGLRSVEEALGGKNYPRLRIGIGQSAGRSLEEFVLEPFLSEEEEALGSVLERGKKACLLWVKGPVEEAMNQINTPVS